MRRQGSRLGSTSSADEQVWCGHGDAGRRWEKGLMDFQVSTTVPVCLSAHSFNGSFLCSNSGGVIEATIRVTSDSFSEFRGSLSAFAAGSFLPNFSAKQSHNLNGHFLDGISVLLREDSSPELRHVHSFVIGNYENIVHATGHLSWIWCSCAQFSDRESLYLCATQIGQPSIKWAASTSVGDELCLLQ